MDDYSIDLKINALDAGQRRKLDPYTVGVEVTVLDDDEMANVDNIHVNAVHSKLHAGAELS